ncbi:hypothetical protein [Fibrella aquatilis]|uniref:Uncharacterized protein n=1 Tax=Fibrella aquatilis TaxID=2817059 RepID=A0A939G771_9BACT|nr:hypothetical protein [Fibrella aquatilis]MBO0931904.1 hypothetical protein [Fibrella aquatilis]
MFLVISTSTFIVLATIALVVWSGLVIWFTGRSRTKKKTRPTPTVMTFFQPTAGKIAVDVPMPMANYTRSELIPLLKKSQHAASEAILTQQATPPGDSVPTPQQPLSTELDDPTFAPAEPNETGQPATVESYQPIPDAFDIPASPIGAEAPYPTGFRLLLDRQLLRRLLSDDSICQEFEEARALTLDRQRDTGRTYASLFREVISDKPADVQAMLLNLLDDDEVDDYERTYPAFA